jgi:predicted MPP superfamily phosphohydrolase
MLSRAIRILHYLAWAQPADVIASVMFLCVIGAIVGTGTSIWLGRRQKRHMLAMEGVRPGLTFLLFCLGDWGLLHALPPLKLSFSTDITLPLLSSIIVRLLVFWGLLATSMLLRWRGRHRGQEISTRAAAILFLVTNFALCAVQVDAYVLEPLWVDTNDVSVRSGKLDATMPPVRIVHLSDTHIERSSYREASIVQQVNALHPDIIVLTGDYLNLSRVDDPVSAEHFRQLVAQLQAPYGIYAVRGSLEWNLSRMYSLIDDTGIIWLEQEAVSLNVRGQEITLVGVACSHRVPRDTFRLDAALAGVPDDAFTVLLYHSPDLIAEAAERGIDLYLGGHTHGGQLRLPFYGAMVTSSVYGKQYEAGLYEREGTTMYISRGIGFEGGGMPRARFLCRPEVVSVEVGG